MTHRGEIASLLAQARSWDPDDRKERLRARGVEPELAARILDILGDAPADATLTEGSPGDATLARVIEMRLNAHVPTESLSPGATFDGYRLVREIGSGGMGVVWEAEQLEPVTRRVALKVIRAGLESGAVVARFASERQALARMGHPNIAQVFAAGTAPGDRPYFVMEYVDGEAITTWCERRNLRVRERLELFLQACDAVQHAHRKGILHRDLKPSNILVAANDGRPVVKVIDFGVARVLDDAASAAALFGPDDDLVGTPEYMSPEQAGDGSGDVDTRTDVYGLGATLYQVLTGARPIDARARGLRGLDAALRAVREVVPEPPSRRVPPESKRLARRLRGDLDAIVLRCLRKDRDRRYGSVAELADDVRAHLRHRPVSTGPDSLAYRAAKLIRRHRTAAVGVAAVLAVLLAGIAGTLAGLDRARDEARVAEAVNAFLNEDLLAAGSPYGMGPDVTIRQVLDAAAQRVGTRFASDPAVEASIRRTLGTTYTRLGEHALAQPHLERALELYRITQGSLGPGTLRVLNDLGELYLRQDRLADARRVLAESLDGLSRTEGRSSEAAIAALVNLGLAEHYEGRLAEAEARYREGLSLAPAGSDDAATLSTLHNLAAVVRDQGRYEEAEKLTREVMARTRRAMGPEHPDTLASMNALGRNLRSLGRYDEAEAIYREVLEIRRRVLGPNHPDTLTTLNNLGFLLSSAGRLEQAEPFLREAYEGDLRARGASHENTITSMGNLGEVLGRLGRLEEAETLLRRSVELSLARPDGVDRLAPSMMRKYGTFLVAAGRRADGTRMLREAYARAVSAGGADSPEARRIADDLKGL